MRVLVTGASGYLGRSVLPQLTALGADVHAVSRRTGHGSATWHAVDLLHPDAPERLVDLVRPDAILHLAWCATPGTYWTTPENLDWRRATGELAAAAARFGVSRFVGAGTCAEYDWSAGHCDETTTALAPATLYGQSKLGAWRDVEAAAGHSLSVAWGRIFFVFGGAEHPARLVPSVAGSLLRGEPALLTHGRQVRDFLHVEDVAGALVAILRGDVVGALNVAAGEPHSVADLVRGIAERIGRPDLLRLGARPATDAPIVTASVRRLRDEVGWAPGRTFEAAIELAVSHWTHAGSVTG